MSMPKTVGEVINELTKTTEPVDNTVDKLLFGDSNQKVAKIAVCFMPTYKVIKQAHESGVNLLICHEGIFYSHGDKMISEESTVYLEKKKYIEESNIAIFRNHDAIHRSIPDGIMQGMTHILEWDDFVVENKVTASIFHLPVMSLATVVDHIKHTLHINQVRYIGKDLSMKVSKVAILVGYRGGGATAIPTLVEENADLVIYGEGPEWETPEYIRDAIEMGKNKAAIILGHLESEEPGMLYLAKTMQQLFPNIPVTYISTKNCIQTR